MSKAIIEVVRDAWWVMRHEFLQHIYFDKLPGVWKNIKYYFIYIEGYYEMYVSVIKIDIRIILEINACTAKTENDGEIKLFPALPSSYRKFFKS